MDEKIIASCTRISSFPTIGADLVTGLSASIHNRFFAAQANVRTSQRSSDRSPPLSVLPSEGATAMI
jgi:hypothetical protein